MSELSRRGLITGICGIAALSMTPLTAEAASVVTKAPGGKLTIRVRDISKVVAVGSSVQIGKVKGQPVALLRSGPSTFSAFSLLCPHQGITVVKDGEGWVCNAHGSKFEKDGELNFGPATTALAPVPVKVKSGVITIG